MTEPFADTIAASGDAWAEQGHRRRRTAVFLMLAAVLFLPVQALGQPSNNPDAVRGQRLSPFEAAREAFDALPEPARRKIQDALVWSGDYKGGIDGEFGRMTYAAILAFEKRMGKTAGTGTLSAADIEALEKLAARERAAAGFREVRDPVSGITIGLPARILPASQKGRSGAAYLSADRQAHLSLFQIGGDQPDLKELYADLRSAPGQKVTYGVLRNGFLVVTAERANELVYTRAASGEGRGGTVLRGFTLAYPKSQRRVYEKLVIAVSNSFKPFATAAVADGPQPAAAAVGAVNVVATTLAVAPDTYMTVLGPAGCRDPRIGKAPATLLAHDRSTGLALLRAPVGGGAPVMPVLAAAGAAQPAFALFADETGPVGDPQISLARGELTAEAGNLRLRIAMPVSGTGALLSVRPGVIAGLAGLGQQQKAAGPVPPASRPVIGPPAISSFLAAAGVKTGAAPETSPAAGPAAIAAPFTRALAPLYCTK